jgi:hypothetical protein
LKPLNTELILEVTKLDADGHLISTKRMMSKSYLVQWNQYCYVQFSAIALSVLDVNNVSRSIGSNSDATANAGIDEGNGIIVGTDNTTVTLADYYLQAPLNYGSDAGELSASPMSFGVPVDHGSYVQYWMQRTFTNNTGSPITIRECGCMMRVGSYWFMMIRDVFSDVEVAAGQSVIIRYGPKNSL